MAARTVKCSLHAPSRPTTSRSMATSILGRARVGATTASVFRVLVDDALPPCNNSKHRALRRLHHCRFGFCNGAQAGCPVWIGSMSSSESEPRGATRSQPGGDATISGGDNTNSSTLRFLDRATHFSKSPLHRIAPHDALYKKSNALP